MPKIGRFPPFGKRYFRRVRKLLGRGHFEHFWRLAYSVACLSGRRSLARHRKFHRDYRTRQAIAYFLNHADWDAPELLWLKAIDTLTELGYRPGDTLYFILDDTQQRKRGRIMAAVAKLFMHAEKYYTRGHTILAGCFLYRGVLIPCAVRLWANEAFCTESQKERHEKDRLSFVTLTNLAGQIIKEAPLPKDSKVIALFDSYYLCPAVVSACQARLWDFVSVAKKNRNFYPGGRSNDKRKIGEYGAKVLREHGKWLEVKGKKQKVVQRKGKLSKAGWMNVVFSQRPGEKKWVALVSNRRDWDSATVLGHYFLRWPIELLFKMSKQELGLGDYQILRYRGVVRYLHLVMIAYLLLTHLGLHDPDVQAAIKQRSELRLPSIPTLQQHLRHLLWEDTFSQLDSKQRFRPLVAKLRPILML
jgi:DDE superfamily endonuclease